LKKIFHKVYLSSDFLQCLQITQAFLAEVGGGTRKKQENLFTNNFHSHPIGNRLKAIDFIGGFELHGSKKRLIPSHSTKKRQKRPIFEGFCGILMG
jgi:hypothetical protein